MSTTLPTPRRNPLLRVERKAYPASKVFRDLTTSSRTTSDDEPIAIDATQSVLKLFIELVTGTWTPGICILQVSLLLDVVILAIKYDCGPVLNTIVVVLTYLPYNVIPWNTFVIAAKVDSVKLAKLAIKRFDKTDFDWTGNNADDGKVYKSDIDSRYTVALITASLRCLNGSSSVSPYSSTSQRGSQVDGSTIADAFKLQTTPVAHTK